MLVDETSDERIHRMLAGCDRRDLGLRKRGQNQTIGHVHAKLIAATASAREASKACVDPEGVFRIAVSFVIARPARAVIQW